MLIEFDLFQTSVSLAWEDLIVYVESETSASIYNKCDSLIEGSGKNSVSIRIQELKKKEKGVYGSIWAKRVKEG